MNKRVCKNCGTPNYSADTRTEWTCNTCGENIPVPDSNKKPTISSNTNGNIFSVMHVAADALRNAGQKDKVLPMRMQVMGSKTYDEALRAVMDYVEFN